MWNERRQIRLDLGKILVEITKGRLQNKNKKTDLRTLSQKEGWGPDQIPKFLACEIGT